ncbi:MAG TPA: protein kinase [Pseudomonadota bacterium]|nr:protein kinase [Pseudomonadota bacterium]
MLPLPLEEETHVLSRAVSQGDLVAEEVPPETGSGPPVGESLRFGKRIDRLLSRGRISEEKVLAILREIRTEKIERDATILPNRQSVERDLGVDLTMLPGVPLSDDPVVTPSHRDAGFLDSSQNFQFSGENETDGTLDGSLVGWKGPAATHRFPVENWERYEFEKLLGQGGMGAVYKARDKRLGRTVALKFIKGGDEQMTHRFLQEARAQSRLEHPGICHVYEVGEVEGKAYIAMQFVDGDNLDKAQKSMTLEQKVEILRDIAQAMHHAHEKGVIHRDLKPSNVMVEKKGEGGFLPVVMDFGLAREAGEGKGLTESGAVMGTPAFMSPEQARGEARHVDRRSDVYSLGATLFDLLAGRAPFEDATVANILIAVMSEEAPLLRKVAPTMPEALETICARCLTKDKEQRYATAQALADDLTRFLNSEKITAKKVGLVYRLKWRARQNPTTAALMASLCVLILFFSAYGIRQSYLSRKQAELQRYITQESKDNEWLIRVAYALPLHNVERDQAQLRKRLSQLKLELKKYGSIADGLGHYALGRGHLSLHEHKQAIEELTKAQEKGENSPELHAALGRALGELYHEELVKARRSGERTWVEVRQKELQKLYLEPAKSRLSKALAKRYLLVLDSPEYIQGLIEFYDGKYAEADYNAQLAFVQKPYLSEALNLRGEIAQEQAQQNLADGKLAEARALLETAIQHFRTANDISRSDGAGSAALARAYLDLADLDRLQGQAAEGHFAQAKAFAEQTIVAFPSDRSGYYEKARTIYFSTKSGKFKGDRLPRYKEGIRILEEELPKEQVDFLTLDLLGNLYNHLAYTLGAKGLDPMPSFERAQRFLERAIRAAPQFPWPHNDLGVCLLNIGNYHLERGNDPRPDYTRAIASARRAIELDPKYLFAYNNVVSTLAQYSDYCLSNGCEIEEMITISKSLAAQCGVGCERYLTFQRNTSVLLLNHSIQLVQRRSDPHVEIQAARLALERQRAVDKNLYSICLFSRYADWIEAAWALQMGKDPTAQFAAALLALEGCKKLGEKAAEPYLLQARLLRLSAEWEQKQGRSSEPLLEQALSAATTATDLDAEVLDHWVEKSRAAYLLGRVKTGRKREASFAESWAAVERGQKVSAQFGALWALRAVVGKAQASLETDPARAAEARTRAQASWEKALRQNRFLENEYGPLWKKE